MCDNLLFDLSPLTHRTHEAPISVNLSSLLDRRVSEIHGASSGMEISHREIQDNPLGWHYTASCAPIAIGVDLILDTWPWLRRPLPLKLVIRPAHLRKLG